MLLQICTQRSEYLRPVFKYCEAVVLKLKRLYSSLSAACTPSG